MEKYKKKKMAFKSLDIRCKQSTVIAEKRETKMVSPKGSPSLLPWEDLLPGETLLPGEGLQGAAQEERMHTQLSHLPELRVREGSRGDYGDLSLQARLLEARGKTFPCISAPGPPGQHWSSPVCWETTRGQEKDHLKDRTISEVHTQSGTVPQRRLHNLQGVR